MHGPINVKSPNNTSKLQMGFNLAFKWLTMAISCASPFLVSPARHGEAQDMSGTCNNQNKTKQNKTNKN
jgi:hypothetical protein